MNYIRVRRTVQTMVARLKLVDVMDLLVSSIVISNMECDQIITFIFMVRLKKSCDAKNYLKPRKYKRNLDLLPILHTTN